MRSCNRRSAGSRRPAFRRSALAALVAACALFPQAVRSAPGHDGDDAPFPLRVAADRDEAPDGPGLPDKQIVDFQMWRLSQDLQLSDEEAARFFPRMRRLGEAQGEMRQQRGRLMRELRTSLEGGRGRDLGSLVVRIRRQELDSAQELATLEDDALSVLSARQQAQYLVSRDLFMRDLRRLADEARSRPRGARPGGPGGSGFDRPPRLRR